MQIDLIETFLDLCETRSFNRTAERLGVTQSTVSGRVRTLEQALGRRLFTRSRAGTQLTAEGMAFEPHARGLRHGWAEALRAVRHTTGVTLRLSLQHDLALEDMGAWVRAVQEAIEGAAFYIETDYSTQICADLVTGALDFGVLFTPKHHPDLHFETIGEIGYRMVSTESDRLADVRPARYVLANFSPAFAQAHAALLPALGEAPMSSGHSGTIEAILGNTGGAAYVLRSAAERLVREGRAKRVADAPAIQQPVYAGLHIGRRHRALHRRLLGLFRSRFAASAARSPRTRPR